MFIGIDIGGANTKVATSDGGFVDSVYAPLWKNNTIIHDVVLSELKKQFEPGIEAVGVVMTGELCDCFATKREGVLHIKSAVSDTFKNAKFFDRMCTFKSSSYVDKDPLSFAATNWLASAKLVSERYKNAVFVDVGSTTTDVIPIVGGEIKAKRTDLERLKYGELIYSGILRTNVATLLKKVNVGEGEEGEECNISSELFAITADVYLALGYLNEGDYSCESPDSYAFAGRENEEKSRVSAVRRLARVVCSDLEGIGEDSAVGIAEQVKNVQVQELIDSIGKIKERYGLRKLVAAGTGDFIAKEAAESLNIDFLSLSSVYGKRISATFPAYAVAKLLEQEQNRK